MSDFSSLAGMYPLTGSEVEPDMKQGPEGAPNPQMEEFRGMAADFAAADAQNKPAFQLPPGVKKVTLSANGMDFSGVDPRIFEALMDKSKKHDEIVGAFHATATQLQGKETNASSGWGAVGNVAGRLAGNLAAQKDMPGWVRGLGETAREMNPTPQELRQERLGVQHMEAQATEQSMRLLETQGRVSAMASVAALEHTRKKEADAARATQKKLEIAGKLIKDSKGQVDAKQFKAIGLDDDDVELMVSQAKGVATAEKERTTARAELVKSQNSTKVQIANIKASTSKALANNKFTTPEARLKNLGTLQRSIVDFTRKLENDEIKIQSNIFSSPEEKADFKAKHEGSKAQLEVLKKLYTQMETAVKEPVQTGADALKGKMAEARGVKPSTTPPPDKKTVTYDPTTDTFK